MSLKTLNFSINEDNLSIDENGQYVIQMMNVYDDPETNILTISLVMNHEGISKSSTRKIIHMSWKDFLNTPN